MLKIREYLCKHGIEKTVNDFKLDYKDLGHKFILKYSQLDSPKTKVEVCESRGLILHKETFEIISYPFKRFFEYDDCLSPKLKSNKTVYTEKRDGTLIQIYFDNHISKWCINTMFSECKEFLYLNGQQTDLNFEKLVLNLFEEYETSFENFDK